ncbi:MAG: DUF6600 domain-containing protein [Thermoanaerobaculia bacterium]|nr:DUF6600 domain-containing protein [Thermoanaerobaculia bacterium]
MGEQLVVEVTPTSPMNEVEGAMIVENLHRLRGTSGSAVVFALTIVAAAAHAAEDGGYSYARTLEGTAQLVAEAGEREDLELNQPLLAGDRVTVSPRARLEVALSDHNLLRIDGDSSLRFRSLAGSPDREDPSTVLELEYGNLQVIVARDALGRDLPQIETGNATVFLSEAGTYRITTDGDWTEVTVRDGLAEVVAGRRSEQVERGQSLILEGWRDAEARLRVAGREDGLERWGEDLDREASYDDGYRGEIDPSLEYRAASLSRHGRWDRYEGRTIWIPRVAADWRPYHHGRWVPTPLGLTWVSHERWGWVPYHYGTWDYLPGYGWAWYPGRTFGPSWVYWYWTNDYAAWVPTGYYQRYYGRHHGWDSGFRWGVYGWAGGSWDYYDSWNFCPTRYLGRRDQHRNTRRGDHVDRRDRHAVPRGILTTDTRDITRDRLQRPAEIVDTLAGRRRRGDGDLPDVTPFVARRGELPKEIQGEILVDREARRRGVERALPDDVNGSAPTTAAPPAPERERRARGRVIESQTPDGRGGAVTAPESEPTTRERRPRVIESERPRRLEPRSDTPPAPRSEPTDDDREGRRRVYRPETPPPQDDARPGEEIRSRRRAPESPPPPAADERPPVRRVIEGARRNHPPTPPPTPSGSVERERTRERERPVDSAGRSRRAEPPKSDPPAGGSPRQAGPREPKPESPPPPKDDSERRRRPRPPGD